MSTEIWKTFETIEVSNQGNLKTRNHKDGTYTGANTTRGYKHAWVKGKHYYVHRLVLNLFSDVELTDPRDLDHINGIKHDNRIENLRMVTHRENGINCQCHRNGKLPYCNFDKVNNKWMSQINVNKKKIYLGRFTTMKEAYDCSIKERIRLGLPV